MTKRRGTRASPQRKTYDFSGGVRGKYAARYGEGRTVVVLDPDVAAVFPDSSSVNRALRALARKQGREAGKRAP